jgi:hypothetical protein
MRISPDFFFFFFLAQLAVMQYELQASQGAAAGGSNASNTEDTLV